MLKRFYPVLAVLALVGLGYLAPGGYRLTREGPGDAVALQADMAAQAEAICAKSGEDVKKLPWSSFPKDEERVRAELLFTCD